MERLTDEERRIIDFVRSAQKHRGGNVFVEFVIQGGRVVKAAAKHEEVWKAKPVADN